MSIIVATGVYALLLKFLQKNSPHNVQTNGGGSKAFWTMLKKLHFSCTMTSLIMTLQLMILVLHLRFTMRHHIMHRNDSHGDVANHKNQFSSSFLWEKETSRLLTSLANSSKPWLVPQYFFCIFCLHWILIEMLIVHIGVLSLVILFNDYIINYFTVFVRYNTPPLGTKLLPIIAGNKIWMEK